MSNKHALLIIAVVSLLTHFVFFGHPNQTVFDEVHFGKFISGYYTQEYFFDIHPPLGKLIIAGFGKLFNFSPEFSFAQIGDPFPDNSYRVLRFLPSLAGALLPLVLFALAREMGFGRFSAFAIGFLTAIENALIVQSRFILLDAFLLLFGFTALWLYARYRNHRSWKYLIGVGLFAGMAMSVKWTGLAFLAIPAILELWDVVKARSWKHLPQLVVFFGVVPFAVYFASFAVHFGLLPKTGTGDAFMTPEFQKTLQGNANQNRADLETPTLLGKFLELNAEMYDSNRRLDSSHTYGSSWEQWPFMVRPIYYWNDSINPHPGGEPKIYLIGNPVIWWASTFALFILVAHLLAKEMRERIAYILIGGYLINLLPFVGISRVMFLYHYFAALIFAIFILLFVIERTFTHPKKATTALLVLATISFIFFAPLTYGLKLSRDHFEARKWFKTWE